MAKEGARQGQIDEGERFEPDALSPDTASRVPDAERKTRIVRHETAAREAMEAALYEARENVRSAYAMEKILDGWRQLKEAGETAQLSREDLRRLDMHVALTDPVVLYHLLRASPDAADLVETLDRETVGSWREPDPTPVRNDDPFADIRLRSTREGRPLVEHEANARTESEHRRLRFGTKVAMDTKDIGSFLHALDTWVGEDMAGKLTSLERANLVDQLRHLLKTRDWPHPTQDMARSFVFWEKALGDSGISGYTLIPEWADFTPEPRTEASRERHMPLATAPRRTPTFWENLRNAPRDMAKMVFDEDGYRTGSKKE